MLLRLLFILSLFATFSSKAQEFANSVSHNYQIKYYTVQEGENLHEIAAKFDLGFDELVSANPDIENGNIIYVDQKLILPIIHLVPDAKQEGILINLAEMRLYFFQNGDARSFPISIGSDERTPTGTTKVVFKKRNPTWKPPLSIRLKKPELPDVVQPGPDNPLGQYALYLNSQEDIKWQGIAIHGTDNDSSIGTRVSLGCMRLYQQDIEELYDIIEIGTEVNIVNQEIKVDKIGNKVYLEMHLRKKPDLVLESWGIKDIICKKIPDCEKKINWHKVDEVALRNLGIPEKISY